RAEHRLLLRQDNADERLTPLAHKLGLVSDERLERVEKKVSNAQTIIKYLQKTSIDKELINPILKEKNSSPIPQNMKMVNLLSRPGLHIRDLAQSHHGFSKLIEEFDEETLEQAEIKVKYESYFEKELELVAKMKKMEDHQINPEFDYSLLKSLSKESREKLLKIKPRTIG